MKQQDANKLMAFFLTFIMLSSVFLSFVFQNIPDQQIEEEETTQDFYDSELWTFNQPFDSISDALNITPVGAESASYIDLESMTPQMAQEIGKDPLFGQLDNIYKSNTTKVYYSNLLYDNNRSEMVLSTMFPEKNDFEYILMPNSYPPILRRLDMNGYYNVMGTPVLLATGDTIMGVLSIVDSLNKTNTSYDKYEKLLSKVPDAPFQTITSNISFAKQYYMGIRINNGSYERTSAYLDLKPNTLKNLTRLESNSTKDGFMQYNLTRNGNYTLVRAVSQDLLRIFPGNEETS